MNNPLVLLAQEKLEPGIVDKILGPDVLPLLIPIVAIIGGIAVAITMIIVRHRERMAGLLPPGKDDEKGGR
jgi:hypothetical protein